MKAIKLQRSTKLHHYWLSQYIKAIVLHQREFEFEFWPIRKFHFIQPGPVPSTILNFCPIRWLLFHLPSWILVQSEDCFPSTILNFWPIRDMLPPPYTPSLRGIELTLLHYSSPELLKPFQALLINKWSQAKISSRAKMATLLSKTNLIQNKKCIGLFIKLWRKIDGFI